jgi:hypothetical protein
VDIGVLGGEDAPCYVLRWEDSWYMAVELLGSDVEHVDRQLEDIYYRLERWPKLYSYSALRQGSETRSTFAKAKSGERLRVWYRIEEEQEQQAACVPLLWVDIAPFDDGQDDPF